MTKIHLSNEVEVGQKLKGDEDMEKTMFVAVEVVGGRLFKGSAYRVEGGYVSRYGYAGSGVCPLRITQKVKVWVPSTGLHEYVNAKYVVERKVTKEQYDADFAKFSDGIITNTMKWCRSKSTTRTEKEIMLFAYKVIRKNHPDMVAAFEAKYGFKEDVVESIKSTIAWALGLGYRSDKAVLIANRALCNSGLVDKPEFHDVWVNTLNEKGLGKYAELY